MMGEKMEATKWFLLLVAGLIFLTLLGYLFRPISMRVQREVLVQSHQYKEGMVDRATVFQASLAEIDARLAMGVDEQTRKGLLAQKALINVQLSAARR